MDVSSVAAPGVIDNVTSTLELAFNVSNVTSTPFNVTEPPWNLLQKLMFCTWLCISMICAIFGNLMVIVVVARHRGMQTRTNMFLVNLAVADFMTGVLLAPFTFTTLVRETWIFGDVMCNINGFLNAICLITSTHTLMYISIHKYVSITRPFSRILNHRKILVMICCTWLWAITCAVLTMCFSTVLYKPKTTQCGPEYPRNQLEYIHHSIISFTNILIPLAIMIFAYARMYCEFRQHSVRLRQNTTLQSDQILQQQVKIIKTLFIVLACFVLCWLPYGIYSTYVSMLKDKSDIPGWANAVAYCFMYMNSGCNPIIYAWRSPAFREGYKEILCQRSGYVVSDDTIRDSNSPSIIRRLSALLHSSFRSTAFSLRMSDEISTPVSCKDSMSSPTHTRLRRATAKTAKGSSIIRKDGSVIITKNGKIVSIRPDSDTLRRDKSFSGFEDVKMNCHPSNGISRSLGDIHTLNKGPVDLTPLLRQTRHISSRSSCHSVSNASVHSSNCSRMSYTSSLPKIESLEEPDENITSAATELLEPPSTKLQQSHLKSDKSLSETDITREVNVPSISAQSGRSISPGTVSDSGDVFVQSPVIITFNSQELALSSMCLEPNFKHNEFAKSETRLDDAAKEALDRSREKQKYSKSSSSINKVSLLRCPSLETLDFPKSSKEELMVDSPKSNTEGGSSVLKKLIPRSPLYMRRWLSNSNVEKNGS